MYQAEQFNLLDEIRKKRRQIGLILFLIALTLIAYKLINKS